MTATQRVASSKIKAELEKDKLEANISELSGEIQADRSTVEDLRAAIFVRATEGADCVDAEDELDDGVLEEADRCYNLLKAEV